MDSVYTMKIFIKFSMVFAVLTFILYYVDKRSTLPTLFIYACVSLVVSLIAMLKNRSHKSAIILLPLILLPMILVKNIWEACFMIVVIFNAIIIVQKGLKIEYKDSSTDLVKGIALTAPIYLVSAMTYMFNSMLHGDNYNEHLGKYKNLLFGAVDKDTGVFIFIYFVTTIILLRILRFEANNKNKLIIKKLNIISSVSIVGLLIISFIIDKIAGNKVAELLRNFMGWHGIIDSINIPGGRKPENIIMTLFQGHTKHKKGLASKTTHGNFRMNIIIIIAKVIVIALILLCIYILIRTAVRMILRKSASRMSRDGEECVEHIEKIKKKKQKKNNLILSIADILKNKSNNERIKIYYELYMKFCVNNDLDINRSDTSLDIQNKSQGLLDKNIVRRLREIYIKVKYSNFSADKKTCNEVKKMVDTMSINSTRIK